MSSITLISIVSCLLLNLSSTITAAPTPISSASTSTTTKSCFNANFAGPEACFSQGHLKHPSFLLNTSDTVHNVCRDRCLNHPRCQLFGFYPNATNAAAQHLSQCTLYAKNMSTMGLVTDTSTGAQLASPQCYQCAGKTTPCSGQFYMQLSNSNTSYDGGYAVVVANGGPNPVTQFVGSNYNYEKSYYLNETSAALVANGADNLAGEFAVANMPGGSKSWSADLEFYPAAAGGSYGRWSMAKGTGELSVDYGSGPMVFYVPANYTGSDACLLGVASDVAAIPAGSHKGTLKPVCVSS